MIKGKLFSNQYVLFKRGTELKYSVQIQPQTPVSTLFIMLAAPIRRTTSQLSKWNPRKSFFKKPGTALGPSQVELGKKPDNGTRKRKRLKGSED